MMAAERGPIRVVGRYALYHEIAAGGMATVHIGRLLGPVGFARTVAVKRLHPQYAKDPEFVSGFLDEARLAARVQHPNVVATIDVVATDGELFLIMDYVRGESLSKLLRVARKHGMQCPPRIASAIMCGFLHGMHAAHEAKNERGEPLRLVHRDVSPQNVLVGSDGIARVLDFGVAKAAGRVQITRDGQIKGKLAYMPPEQLGGKEITRAVDVYASAVVMWETLTGERLFKGDTEAETLAKILREPVVPPSHVANVPPAFDAPLMRALSRDATKRQATARELSLELERCVGIASPTEVGEWVEAVVGPILTARENQIAAMESASAGMSGYASGGPEPESGSDVSGVPRSLAHLQPPGAWHGAGPSRSSTSTASSTQPPLDEPASRITGSRATGTMSLPVDRRLPIMASLAGLTVLLVIVAVVIAGRAADGKKELAADPSASGVSAAAAATSPPQGSAAGAAAGAGAASESASASAASASASAASASAASAASAAASGDPVASPSSAAATGATATNTSTATSHPPTRPPSTAGAVTGKSATGPSTPPPRKNCDQNYTIDEHGHKKYKLECM